MAQQINRSTAGILAALAMLLTSIAERLTQHSAEPGISVVVAERLTRVEEQVRNVNEKVDRLLQANQERGK
jgi:precorrin-6B methylase 1